MMQTLIKREIDDLEFEVVINTEHKYWKLVINGNDWFMQDVDLAQVIRAVAQSDDLYDFLDAINGVWYDEKIFRFINAMVFDDE